MTEYRSLEDQRKIKEINDLAYQTAKALNDAGLGPAHVHLRARGGDTYIGEVDIAGHSLSVRSYRGVLGIHTWIVSDDRDNRVRHSFKLARAIKRALK